MPFLTKVFSVAIISLLSKAFYKEIPMTDYHLDTAQINDSADNINPLETRHVLVIGVGGGGCNALQHAINERIDGVKFIAINTDTQSLRKSTAHLKVQIGVNQTGGLGAGCDPNKGFLAAQESLADIKAILKGADMVFITAGMGGGTGTGATPLIAKVAHDLGALTVGVVTRPFKFEGRRHIANANEGIAELSKHIDSLLVIDNDKLLRNLGSGITLVDAFKACDDVLYHAVRGITDFIVNPGFINVDFNDVLTVMRGRGFAMIGTGYGKGVNCVADAVKSAICSPLVDSIVLSSAAGLLANLRISSSFPINLVNDVCNSLQEYANEEADFKFGMIYDETLESDELHLTVLITGITQQESLEKESVNKQSQQYQQDAMQSQQRPQALYSKASLARGGNQGNINAYNNLQHMQYEANPSRGTDQNRLQSQSQIRNSYDPKQFQSSSPMFNRDNYFKQSSAPNYGTNNLSDSRYQNNSIDVRVNDQRGAQSFYQNIPQNSNGYQTQNFYQRNLGEFNSQNVRTDPYIYRNEMQKAYPQSQQGNNAYNKENIAQPSNIQRNSEMQNYVYNQNYEIRSQEQDQGKNFSKDRQGEVDDLELPPILNRRIR